MAAMRHPFRGLEARKPSDPAADRRNPRPEEECTKKLVVLSDVPRFLFYLFEKCVGIHTIAKCCCGEDLYVLFRLEIIRVGLISHLCMFCVVEVCMVLDLCTLH
jgi:hypothetical protein